MSSDILASVLPMTYSTNFHYTSYGTHLCRVSRTAKFKQSLKTFIWRETHTIFTTPFILFLDSADTDNPFQRIVLFASHDSRVLRF